jgi:predicted permease
MLRFCRALLHAAAPAVPWDLRRDWLAEWEGELWALQSRNASGIALLAFTLGGVRSGLWERGRRLALHGMWQDLRHAARRLWRTPGFTLTALLVLALGIGANTALFVVLKAALLDRGPWPQSERLVVVDLLLERRAGAPADTFSWSWPKFQLAREQLRSVEKLAAFAPRTATLTGAGDAARIGVEFVTPDYLELLGVRARAGRVFNAAERGTPSAVVLLSHALWVSQFGSDAQVVGRSVVVDGVSLEIIGVLPEGFRGLSGSADLWMPVEVLALQRGARRLENAWSHWLRAVARLAPGWTLEQARAAAVATGSELTRAYPDPSGGGSHGVTMVPLSHARVNPVSRIAVTAVSAAAIVLLLIACANIASLLLARAAARRADTAVRAALGASRARLAREFLFETLLLALAGGLAGLLLAFNGLRLVTMAARSALDTTGTRNLQFLDTSALHAGAELVAIGFAFALITGVLLGILPARFASRPDLTRDLRLRGGLGSRRGELVQLGRNSLVTAQLALTFVLLAGAGLMTMSYSGLSAIDAGFHNDNVLSVSFERGPGPTPQQDLVFEAEMLERIAALPAVVNAAVGPCAPLTMPCEIVGVRQIDDGAPADFSNMESTVLYEVSPDYFSTLRVPLLEGRTFMTADAAGSRPVAVVSEAAARTFFPGVSPIGHRIAMTHALTEEGRLAEIIGVVGNVAYGDLEEPAQPAAYFSRLQAPSSYGTLFVHTRGDPYDLVPAVRRALAGLDPDMPLFNVTTLSELRARALARTRVILGLFAGFAAVGLLLSAIGLFGLVSYGVTQRTREMGLRVALGASTGRVWRLVMAQPGILAITGCVMGAAAAAVLTRYVEALLFGVRPADFGVLMLSAMLLLSVALLAAWLPAQRATRIDPATALRTD